VSFWNSAKIEQHSQEMWIANRPNIPTMHCNVSFFYQKMFKQIYTYPKNKIVEYIHQSHIEALSFAKKA